MRRVFALSAPRIALAAVIAAAGCSSSGGVTEDDSDLRPDGSTEAPVDADGVDSTIEPDATAEDSGGDSSVVVPDSGKPGDPCGYKSRGEYKQIGPDIALCLPPVVCTPSETCPRGLGDCVAGKCVFKNGYKGLETLPEAWTTQYCDLKTGGCNGAVQNPLPYDVAKSVAQKYGNPVCADQPNGTGTCVGIAAPPPRMAGNSQIAIDPVTGQKVALWGLGMTPASGVCYELTGNGGTAVVAITDRCAGYCKCGAGGFNECGFCMNASDTSTLCACVGTAPPMHNACCGRGCGTPPGICDWCANNNHPHFDLDDATFSHVCGPDGPMFGSCKLKKVRMLKDCYPTRPNWPN